MIKIIIPGTFATLNEYIDANRTGRGRWNKGNSMKQRDQHVISCYLPRVRLKGPVIIRYTFYERNRRRDLDNVSGYFHKIFQDALVCAGVLPGDGWRYIRGMSDEFEVDSKTPRIEVILDNGEE
jgi:Holliday junction resolvase RusA-like endonuclease